MSVRYSKYPTYTPSVAEWQDDVPNDWKSLALGRIFRRVKRSGFLDEELLSVYRDYGVIPKASRDDNFNKASEDLSPYQLVRPGDLVMNKMKAWQGSIAISEYRGIVSPAYFVYESWRHDDHIFDSRYIHFLLRSPSYIAQYLRRSKGIRVNQWDLDPEAFERIEILLPSLAEQTQIGKFLDYETAKIDALIEKQQQLIAILEEKRQAVISHAVTKGLNPDAPMRDAGVEWLGEVPAHWPTAKLARFIRVGSGEFLPNDEYSESRAPEAGRLVPVVGGNGTSGWASKSNSPPRTMVIGRVGALCGNVHLVNEASWVTDNALRVEASSGFLPEYLVNLLRVRNLNDLADRTAQPLITGSRIRAQVVPVPPTEEQAAVAQLIAGKELQFSTLVEKASGAIALMQERRTALISAAVTGKIDVRGWKAPESIVQAGVV